MLFPILNPLSFRRREDNSNYSWVLDSLELIYPKLGREILKAEVLAITTTTPTPTPLSIIPEATNLDSPPTPDPTTHQTSSTEPNPILPPKQLALPLLLHPPLVEAGMLLLLPPPPALPSQSTSPPIDNSDL